MGEVITILQEKGGVGKSLATMNIAYYFARRGRVLIIDLDGQAANITYYLLGYTSDTYETIMDSFKGKTKAAESVIAVALNLDLLPANVDVAGLSQAHKITTFKSIIEELKEIYDYIFIDVTPSPTWAHLLALSSRGQKIIPIINADAASLQALKSLNDSVREVLETTNPGAEYLGIILNRYSGRTNLSKEIKKEAEKMAKKMHTSLFDTVIRQSVTLSEQPLTHQSIYDYAPGSTAAKDYAALSEEIMERIKK